MSKLIYCRIVGCDLCIRFVENGPVIIHTDCKSVADQLKYVLKEMLFPSVGPMLLGGISFLTSLFCEKLLVY